MNLAEYESRIWSYFNEPAGSNSDFFDSTDIEGAIGDGRRNVWNTLNSVDSSFGRKTSSNVTLTAGDAEYAVPDDLYQMIAIIRTDLDYYPPLEYDERVLDEYTDDDAWGDNQAWALKGSYFIIRRATTGATVQYHYIREITALSGDTQDSDIPLMFQFAVVYYVVWTMCMKERSQSAGFWKQRYDEALEDIRRFGQRVDVVQKIV